MECVTNGVKITDGRLKHVQSQLRIEDGLLTKSGRPVVPAPLRKFITSHIHNIGHWGVKKTYALLKKRFFWSSMYSYTENFVSYCTTCQQTKCDTHPPKAPMIPMFIPEALMQFVSNDIQAIPLRDQTPLTIVRVFENN